ncbi:MAG: alpha/beta hydrolase family esterase [Alphaproteobacteria bacterium]
MHNDEKRSYVLYIPNIPSSIGTVKLPLVIVLHGGRLQTKSTEKTTSFSEKADKEKFIVVYPNGSSGSPMGIKTWNVDHCCGYAMKEKKDDIGFLSTLIDTLINEQAVDPNNVFVTGMSNGGMMAHKVGMELSSKINAIAPVSSGIFVDAEPPVQTVPALIINGELDKSFPMEGGLSGGRFVDSAWDGTYLYPVRGQSEFWAENNGCSDRITEKHLSKTLYLWKYNCPEGGMVLHYVLKDQGHAWPGSKHRNLRGDTPSQTFDATDAIWKFFRLMMK